MNIVVYRKRWRYDKPRLRHLGAPAAAPAVGQPRPRLEQVAPFIRGIPPRRAQRRFAAAFAAPAVGQTAWRVRRSLAPFFRAAPTPQARRQFFNLFAGATWAAALNTDLTDVSVNSDVDLRLRVQIKVTVVEGTTPSFKYQYQKNVGGYVDITAASSNVKTNDSTFFVDGDDCATKLLGGAETFISDNDAAEDISGTFTMPVNFTVGDVIESELSFTLVSSDLANGDDIDFRVVESDGTAFTIYTQIGSIAVTKVAGPFFRHQFHRHSLVRM